MPHYRVPWKPGHLFCNLLRLGGRHAITVRHPGKAHAIGVMPIRAVEQVILWTVPRPEQTLTDCLDLRSTGAMRKRFPIAAVGHLLPLDIRSEFLALDRLG